MISSLCRKGFNYVCTCFFYVGLSQNHDGVECNYVSTLDRVVYSDGRAVGIRKDLSGVLLLDTALQTPVKKAEDHVYLELLLPEV